MTLFPETNNWRAGMQDVSAAIDDAMGELVTVTPTRSGGVNFPSIPEPDKSVTVTAVFTRKPESAFGASRTHGGQTVSPLISTSKPVFQFGYSVLPFAIRQYYRITLLRTGELFEVTDVKDDGVSRLTVDVNQLGRQKDAAPIKVTPVAPIVMRS